MRCPLIFLTHTPNASKIRSDRVNLQVQPITCICIQLDSVLLQLVLNRYLRTIYKRGSSEVAILKMSRHRKAYDDDDLYDDYEEDDYYEEDEYYGAYAETSSEVAPTAAKAEKLDPATCVSFVLESLGQTAVHLSEARVLQMLNMYDCDVEKTIAFFAKEQVKVPATVTSKAAAPGQKAVSLSSKPKSQAATVSVAANSSVKSAASNLPSASAAIKATINSSTPQHTTSTQAVDSGAQSLTLLTARALSELSDDECAGSGADDDCASGTTGFSSKGHLTMVVAGHVDAGKSTLVGHLLLKTGQVASRTLHKFQKESAEVGKGSFALAWVLDEGSSEREHGVTINVAERQVVLPAPDSRVVTVLDAPGHRDYVPNLISGASTADVALLVVPATAGEFESAVGERAQTREHAVLLRALGVRQVLVAVNKMDQAAVEPWSRARFDHIVQRVRALLLDVQFRPEDVRFVPVSGLSGENLSSLSADCPLSSWYKGPSLLQAVSGFRSPSRQVAGRPFRAVVGAVYGEPSESRGSQTQVRVQVVQGCLRCGRGVALAGSSGGAATVAKMTLEDGTPLEQVRAGQSAVFWLADRSGRSAKETSVDAGLVLAKGPSLARAVKMFKATLLTTAGLAVPIIPGSAFELYLHGQEALCIVERLYNMSSAGEESGGGGSSSDTKIRHPRCIPANRQAFVLIRVQHGREVCIEPFKDCPPLGRFALRSKGITAAIGVCRKVPPP